MTGHPVLCLLHTLPRQHSRPKQKRDISSCVLPHLNFPDTVYNSCVDLGFTEHHSPICFRSFAAYVQPTEVLSWLHRTSTFSFKIGHLVWVGRVATLTHTHKGRTWLLLDHHSASVNSHEQKMWAEKHIFSWSLTSSLLSDSQWSHTHKLLFKSISTS